MTAKQYYLHVINDASVTNNSIEAFKFLIDSLYEEALLYIDVHDIKTARGMLKVHIKANKKWNKIMKYFKADKLPMPFKKDAYIKAFSYGDLNAIERARRTKNV